MILKQYHSPFNSRRQDSTTFTCRRLNLIYPYATYVDPNSSLIDFVSNVTGTTLYGYTFYMEYIRSRQNEFSAAVTAELQAQFRQQFYNAYYCYLSFNKQLPRGAINQHKQSHFKILRTPSLVQSDLSWVDSKQLQHCIKSPIKLEKPDPHTQQRKSTEEMTKNLIKQAKKISECWQAQKQSHDSNHTFSRKTKTDSENDASSSAESPSRKP